MPKLSIITINLNNVNGLLKTILSISNQKFNDFEYIIIDGGSSDGSINIIKQFAYKISYWESEPDRGIYNAMNKGIKKAKGEYCLFLNSGDYLYSDDILGKVLKENYDEDLIYGSLLSSENGKKGIIESPPAMNLTFRYFINYTLPHAGTFIKKELFNKTGYFNEKLKITSDWEFFLVAIFKFGATLRSIPYIISVFDTNGVSSLSENKSIIENEREEVLLKHFKYFLPDYTYLDALEFKIQHSFSGFIIKVVKKMSTIFRSK